MTPVLLLAVSVGEIFQTIGAFIVVLGVLIFVHELGHFLAAKSVGIGVPRFSIGFGPRTPIHFRRGETEYVISWIPFGGYVKMASLEEQEAMASLEGGGLEQEFPPQKLFENKPLWARILVISAGVIMNALFAWAAYSGLYAIYGKAEDPTTSLARVDPERLPEAAAPLAELPFGARIVRVGGEEVTSWQDIVDRVMDVGSEVLRFDFADGLEPAVVEIPGGDSAGRADVLASLVPLWEARIGSLTPGYPAARTERLEFGDRVLAIDREELRSWGDLVRIVERSAGREIVLTIDRGGRQFDVALEPKAEEIEGPDGTTREVGRLGIARQADTRRVRFAPLAAVAEGGRRTLNDAGQVLQVLRGMLFGRISPRQLGGPIMIAQVSGQAARLGGAVFLSLMAFLSVNLAILNLLPIPVLDGGHLIFLFAEGIRRKPLSPELRYRLTQAGVLVVFGLMAFALINDLLR